ncbi:hypothetical protein BO86DRAFT_305825, partial [Aspergillus japonicus CBS 114.51]
RVWKTGLPVRSAVLKPHAGRLVVGWVTTSESLLLYVFALSSALDEIRGAMQLLEIIFFFVLRSNPNVYRTLGCILT